MRGFAEQLNGYPSASLINPVRQKSIVSENPADPIFLCVCVVGELTQAIWNI